MNHVSYVRMLFVKSTLKQRTDWLRWLHADWKRFRGCSSVGRAVALQAIGREFEPPQLHQTQDSEQDEFAGPVAQLVRACA